MKHLIAAILLWVGLFSGGPLGAGETRFPALYDVAGIAGDDVLNIRGGPDGAADIIASFGPDQSGIEVIRLDPTGRWGLVNTGETSGWTSMRYLALQPGQGGYDLPRPLICSGTEPFWNAVIDDRQGIRFDIMGEPSLTIAKGQIARANGPPDKSGVVWNAPQTSIAGLMTRANCNDGMSDRSFGIAVDFLLSGPVGSGTIYSGCCSLGGN